MEEKDPHGMDPRAPGAKLDEGKPQLRRGFTDYFYDALVTIDHHFGNANEAAWGPWRVLQVCPRASVAVSQVSVFGATKYTWDGWRDVPDAVTRYGDAADRHEMYLRDGPLDKDSKLHHLAHKAWNELAVLQKMLEADRKDTPRQEQRAASTLKRLEGALLREEPKKEPPQPAEVTFGPGGHIYIQGQEVVDTRPPRFFPEAAI